MRSSTMPKAILELPKMPRSCKKCPLKYYVEPYARSSIWEIYACIWTGNAIPERGKRKDCPLKLVDDKDEQTNVKGG